jgi:hypothetical protein
MSEKNLPDLPTDLAPDASIGEVRAEIDNARHEAARTLGALAERFTVREQARRRVRGAVRSLAWDGRRVREDVRAVGDAAGTAIPPGFRDSAKQVAALLARVPIAVRIGVPALLVLRLLVWRKRRRHSG